MFDGTPLIESRAGRSRSPVPVSPLSETARINRQLRGQPAPSRPPPPPRGDPSPDTALLSAEHGRQLHRVFCASSRRRRSVGSLRLRPACGGGHQVRSCASLMFMVNAPIAPPRSVSVRKCCRAWTGSRAMYPTPRYGTAEATSLRIRSPTFGCSCGRSVSRSTFDRKAMAANAAVPCPLGRDVQHAPFGRVRPEMGLRISVTAQEVPHAKSQDCRAVGPERPGIGLFVRGSRQKNARRRQPNQPGQEGIIVPRLVDADPAPAADFSQRGLVAALGGERADKEAIGERRGA
jgi:hypothetical protein